MPAFGTVDAATAARLADDSARLEKAVGTGAGQSSRNPYGAAYEHNRRLASHADRAARERESLSHWSVACGYEAWSGLCHIPTWGCEPADGDDGEAVKYADHVKACLGIGVPSPIGQTWPGVLNGFLMAEALGFGVWETVAEQAGGVWYTALESRDQGSITGWVVDARGRLVAADQQATWGGIVTIPAAQFVHHVAGAVASDDYSGRGLLRAVEPLYRDGLALHQASIAGARRFSVPTPDVTIDVEKAQACSVNVTAEWVDAELAKWAPKVRDYLAHERAYIARPPWVIVSAYGAGAEYRPDQLESAIDARDRRILSRFLAQWLMLGTSNAGGSYSLGETQVRAAHDNAQAVCDRICRTLDVYIRRAIRWQFGEQVPAERMPRITADGLASEAFVEYLAALPGLISSDVLRPDDNLRDAFRRAMEMPAEDPENRPTARPAPAAAPHGGGLPMVLPRRLQQGGQ